MQEGQPSDPATTEMSLLDAARAVADELESFEAHARALEAMQLDSEQSLSRAGQALSAAVACHGRLAAGLRALGGAVARAQTRQQSATAVIEANARRVQQRSSDFAELAAGLSELGEEARQITELLQALTPRGDAVEKGPLPDFAQRLQAVSERMELSVARAEALVERATERGIVDIARRAKSLGEQLATARSQLLPKGKSGRSA